MKNTLIFTKQNFLTLFNLPKISYDDFCKKICVLDVMDRSGAFVVRSDLDTFVNRVSKKDNRKDRLELYKRKLYEILVVDGSNTLSLWFEKHGELKESLDFYLQIPKANILSNDVFSGRTHSKYGKICKNINFENFYNTKKLYVNDSEYILGLMKVMFEEFKIRNSLVGPAFFDHICQYSGDSDQFWLDFMIGCNRASIFNPVTYRSILDELFVGDNLFAPVMGWNSYQLAFYNSNFKHFVSTDVIPDVVSNGHLLHEQFTEHKKTRFFDDNEKTVDLYLCPSEKLQQKFNFVAKYKNSIDAVLFSPPYFDLELYPSDDQSFDNYSDYNIWLEKYWEQTIIICKQVMKKDAKLGFIISNYINREKKKMTISEDMKNIVCKHLTFDKHYKIQWSVISTTRQAKKTRNGNYEDLWIFTKNEI